MFVRPNKSSTSPRGMPSSSRLKFAYVTPGVGGNSTGMATASATPNAINAAIASHFLLMNYFPRSHPGDVRAKNPHSRRRFLGEPGQAIAQLLQAGSRIGLEVPGNRCYSVISVEKNRNDV